MPDDGRSLLLLTMQYYDDMQAKAKVWGLINVNVMPVNCNNYIFNPNIYKIHVLTMKINEMTLSYFSDKSA